MASFIWMSVKHRQYIIKQTSANLELNVLTKEY